MLPLQLSNGSHYKLADGPSVEIVCQTAVYVFQTISKVPDDLRPSYLT